jgi:hypothetical protein
MMAVIIGGRSMQRFGAAWIRVFFFFVALMTTLSSVAWAYVDPGTTGMISQILYVLFYGALGIIFYFLRSIKQYITNAKQFFVKLIGGRQ